MEAGSKFWEVGIYLTVSPVPEGADSVKISLLVQIMGPNGELIISFLPEGKPVTGIW